MWSAVKTIKSNRLCAIGREIMNSNSVFRSVVLVIGVVLGGISVGYIAAKARTPMPTTEPIAPEHNNAAQAEAEARLGQEIARLRKENEELRAKLAESGKVAASTSATPDSVGPYPDPKGCLKGQRFTIHHWNDRLDRIKEYRVVVDDCIQLTRAEDTPYVFLRKRYGDGWNDSTLESYFEPTDACNRGPRIYNSDERVFICSLDRDMH